MAIKKESINCGTDSVEAHHIERASTEQYHNAEIDNFLTTPDRAQALAEKVFNHEQRRTYYPKYNVTLCEQLKPKDEPLTPMELMLLGAVISAFIIALLFDYVV